ncbi:MAG: L-threonine O-3-phosphate decarboxylase [Anaerocolumna sp.]|jgi:threonine-phosphate decarboxylase|nr:L-threonine O-3-phosphate decarboxylase [Anaerocolumna sp.]
MISYTHGGEIYDKKVSLDFSVNTNPLGIPERVRKILIESVDLYDRYPDDYYRELKTALASEHAIDSDELICANGASDLIYRLCQVIRPGKALLCAPTFVEYEQALKATGCEITYYNLEEENDFALQEDYLIHLTADINMVFLCNPSNPVGNLVDKNLLVKVADKCQELGIFLVVDECFIDFIKEAESLISIRKNYPGLFILRAFTKFYALAGLRLGYGICSRKELMDRLLLHTPSWNVSLPAQLAGVEALKDMEYRNKTYKWLGVEREYLSSGLSSLGFKVYPSKGNFLLFRGKEGLYEELLMRGILIRECKNYRQLGAGYYRIAVKLREDNDQLLEGIGKILEVNNI